MDEHRSCRFSASRKINAAIEPLETRRLFVADLGWGGATVAGNLFIAGQNATIVANIRNLGTALPANAFSVEFRYVDVGFRADADKVDFFDPKAITLVTIPVANAIPTGFAGVNVSFPLTFPAGLAPSRYELVAKLDSTEQVFEVNEDNNVLAIGSGRVLPTDGNLVVDGTDLADKITVIPAKTSAGAGYTVKVNSYAETFAASAITGFSVNAEGGNDVISAVGAVPNFNASGGDGNDKIIGGTGNDTLAGGAGKDYLDGGAGNDRLNGNGGNDRLFGNTGADRLYGYNGNDLLDGGSSSDRLDGGAGSDTLMGGSGNDKFATKDSEKDVLFGASGNDTADADPIDALSSVTRNP